MRRHPRIQPERGGHQLGQRIRGRQHRALVDPHRRHRQRPLPKPPLRRLPMNPLSPRPLRQIHTSSIFTRTFIRSLSPSIRPTARNPGRTGQVCTSEGFLSDLPIFPWAGFYAALAERSGGFASGEQRHGDQCVERLRTVGHANVFAHPARRPGVRRGRRSQHTPKSKIVCPSPVGLGRLTERTRFYQRNQSTTCPRVDVIRDRSFLPA